MPLEMRNAARASGASGDLPAGWSPESNVEIHDVEQLSASVDRTWARYQEIQLETQTLPSLLENALHLTKLAKAHAAYVDAFNVWSQADDVARA